MSGWFGGKKESVPAQLTAEAAAEMVAGPAAPKPTASKAMGAVPVQTIFGGADEEQKKVLASSRGPGMAQSAQLARKYLLGQ